MEMKDYAYPTIMAEKCLKQLHDAVLDKRWGKAWEKSEEVAKWVLEIQEAIEEMKKRDGA